MEWATITWLVLGFGLGLVHAFDADHVMALSVFATRERGARRAIRAGLAWATGHGVMVLAAGVALLWIGRALPASLSSAAEHLVGVVMVGLGVMVWIELLRRRAHLHFHVHDDLPPHAHWHVHEADAHAQPSGHEAHPSGHDAHPHRHPHAPVLVGALHGLAGSAPLLAVLPASLRSPTLGLAYLALFAVGVALAMMLVSGLLGDVAQRLGRRDAAVVGSGRGLSGLVAMRAVSASGSIALGAWLALAG